LICKLILLQKKRDQQKHQIFYFNWAYHFFAAGVILNRWYVSLRKKNLFIFVPFLKH